MEIPPASHIVYVPAAILLGMVLGFMLAKRGDPGDDGRRRYDDDLDDY